MINVARLTLPILQSLHTYLASGNFANMFITNMFISVLKSPSICQVNFFYIGLKCIASIGVTVIVQQYLHILQIIRRSNYMEKSVSVCRRNFNVHKKCHKHVPNRFLINHKIDHLPFTLYDFVRKESRIFRSSHARKLFHTSLCRKKLWDRRL